MSDEFKPFRVSKSFADFLGTSDEVNSEEEYRKFAGALIRTGVLALLSTTPEAKNAAVITLGHEDKGERISVLILRSDGGDFAVHDRLYKSASRWVRREPPPKTIMDLVGHLIPSIE